MKRGEEINLIRKVVWSYIKSNIGFEFDDLFSEAYIAYLESSSRYAPELGKKSTFIWHVVSNHLNNLIKTTKGKREFPADLQTMEILFVDKKIPGPEQEILIKENWAELLASLSEDAQMIVLFLNQGDVYLETDKPRKSRGIIAKELRKKGWSHAKIWAAFKEIKEALAK